MLTERKNARFRMQLHNNKSTSKSNHSILYYKNKMTRMHVMELCTVTKHIGNHTEFTLQKTENWMTFWSTVMTMQ